MCTFVVFKQSQLKRITMKIDQSVRAIALDNGNVTVQVTDIYEDRLHDYTWTLQDMSPEAAKEVIEKLQAFLNAR